MNRRKKNDLIAKVLGGQLQVAEGLLDLSDMFQEAGNTMQAVLNQQQAVDLLAQIARLLTRWLGDLSEWQVSAFHDQYRVLVERASNRTAA